MNMTFRRARPEDDLQAADLIYSAGPAAIEYAFATRKHRAIDFIRWAFRDGSGVIGFRNHRAAIVDGRVAGIGAFYSADEFERLSRMMVWQIIRFYGVFKSPGVLKRAARLEAITPRPGRDALFIQNLGVAAGMRGRGIGSRLLEDQIRAARSQKLRRCILDVAADNTRARKLYERLGFCMVARQNWPFQDDPVHVPDHIRMELIL
ncbi:MAG: GNAT family N-acetyltransferase [Desulfosalsimonadaceae bacterium]